MNFICTVSPRFPENYQIGLTARTWGVEERYESRIRRTSPGDLLFFSLGGHIRSVHQIESDVFRDDTELWPEKDGSLFPFRIRISAPVAVGDVSLRDLSDRISFMRGKVWGGTLMGANGVFNDRLTDADAQLIRAEMHDSRPIVEARRVTSIEPRFPIQLFQAQIEEALHALLDSLGCEPLPTIRRAKRQPEDHYTLLGRDRMRGTTLVIVVDGGKGNSSVLLHTLRDMSYVRQKSEAKDVRGLILTGRVSEDLALATREIPNLQVRGYRIRFEPDPEPYDGTGVSRGIA